MPDLGVCLILTSLVFVLVSQDRSLQQVLTLAWVCTTCTKFLAEKFKQNKIVLWGHTLIQTQSNVSKTSNFWFATSSISLTLSLRRKTYQEGMHI